MIDKTKNKTINISNRYTSLCKRQNLKLKSCLATMLNQLEYQKGINPKNKRKWEISCHKRFQDYVLIYHCVVSNFQV